MKVLEKNLIMHYIDDYLDPVIVGGWYAIENMIHLAEVLKNKIIKGIEELLHNLIDITERKFLG